MTDRTPRRLLLPTLLLGAAVLGAGAGQLLDASPAASTVEVTKYQIEVTDAAGTRRLARPNGNGSEDFTPGADYALDLDGDGVADVDAGVQFVDPTGVLAGTYTTATAPNIDVRRRPAAVGRATPKVALAFVFTVYDDVEGTILIRAGFDLREKGASLPPRFVAALGGLETRYNPLEAVVRTTGPLMPTAVTPQNRTATTYSGPLTLTVGVNGGGDDTTMRFGFSPLPPNLRVKYERGAGDRHAVTYAHGDSALPGAAAAPVDLHAEITSTGGGDATTVVADVRDLPSSLSVDFDQAGSVKDQASVGRFAFRTPAPLFGAGPTAPVKADSAPDVRAKVETVSDGRTTKVDATLDDLASTLDATWYVPDEKGCKNLLSPANPHPCSPRATYTSDGDGIGAADVTVESFEDASAPALPVFVPSERQFVDIASNVEGRTRVRARLENIRSAAFAARPNGFDGIADVGRGDSPLEVNVAVDDRTADTTDDKSRVDLRGVVDPLPRNVSVKLTEESATEPLRFVYEQLGTSDTNPGQAVDLRAHAEIRTTSPADRVDPADCGTAGVTCLDVDAHHVAPRIEAVVTDTPALTDVDLRTTPGTVVSGGTRQPQPPMALRVEVKAYDEKEQEPLRANVSVTDVPRFVRARVAKKADGRPSDVQLHNCDYRFEAPAGCAPGTRGRIGAIAFDVRNTLRGDFPEPRGTSAAFISLIARGDATTNAVEHAVAGRLTAVDEVLFVDNGSVQGLHTKIGKGEPFSLTVDSRNVVDDDTKPKAEWTRSDLVTNLVVKSLPATLDLCVRPAGKAVGAAPAAPFTAKCENAQPFAPDTKAGVTATSFAYEAPVDFAISGSVLTRAYGDPVTKADDTTLRADLSVPVVPRTLEVHLASPAAPATDTRARVVAAETATPVTVDFAADRTLDDAVCADPRPTATATCVKGTLENLPPQFDLLFDGETPQQAGRCGTAPLSLCLRSTGTKPTTLRDLHLSSVAPAKDDAGAVITGLSDAVVLRTPKISLPAGAKVTGTVSLPKQGRGKPAIEIAATPRLTNLDVTLETFVVGDPLPKAAPQRRKATPDLLVVQRGRALKADIHLPEFESVGVRSVRAAGATPGTDGAFLPTQVVKVAFGAAGSDVRVYADLLPEEEPAPGVRVPGDRSLVDLYLSKVPSEFTVCVRPTGDDRAAEPAEATWCDDPDSDRGDDLQEGAFQLATRSDAAIDVDAFFRLVKGAGGDLTAGRLTVEGLPRLVRATFPLDGDDGDLDVAGFTPVAAAAGTVPDAWRDTDLTPTSLGKLGAVVATFDLAAADTGYAAGAEPYEPQRSAGAEIGAVPGQQLGVRSVSGQTYVRGELDRVKRVRVYRTARHAECPNVDDVKQAGYPRYPAEVRADTRYLCVRGDFVPPPAGTKNPITFNFVKDDGAKTLGLRSMLLDDAPARVALTVTETPVLDAAGAFRPACRAAGSAAGCAPPLVRFDQSGAGKLSGTVEYGGTRDLVRLRDLALPSGVSGPALGAAPTPDGWSDWGSDPTGVRAKIGAITRDGVSSPAVIAGLRIPVPASFTLDQVGSWATTHRDPVKDGNPITSRATDLKLRFAAHDAAGTPVGDLGQLAAAVLVEDITSRKKTATTPLLPSIVDVGAQRTADLILVNGPDSPSSGVAIPGEVDASVYLRTNKQTGQEFIQIDGRTSKPISAGVRLVPLATTSLPMHVDAKLRNLPAQPAGDGPGFRVAAEILTPRVEAGCTLDAPGICAAVDALRVTTSIDFAPGGGAPARRVEAVIRHDGASNGVEVESFASVDPADTTHAPIAVDGRLTLERLHLTVANTAANPNNTKSINADFQADVTAPFSAARATNFAVRQKGLRLHLTNYDNGATEHDLRLGPNTIRARRLDGWVAPRVGPVPIPLAYFNFPFTPRNMAHAVDFGCGLFSGGVVDTSAHAAIATRGMARELFVNPLVDRTIVVVPNPVVPLAAFEAAWVLIPTIFKGAMCSGTEADKPAAFELIHRTGELSSDRGLHPGNPVPAAETPAHPVPGARSALPPAPATQPVGGSDVDWTPGQGTHELCGAHHFRTLTVNDGVTLKARGTSSDAVAASGMPTCPSGQQGQLVITARTITVAAGGRVVADGARAIGNSSGNSGASHYAKGGQGSSGSPAEPYGNREVTERQTEMGYGGDGSSGGGLIVLHADTVNLHGSVSANATGGYSGCGAGAEGKHLPGGGGGSGGGILVDAVTLNGAGSLSANGGPGGPGSGGGGGGAGGVIKVFNALGDGNPSQSTSGAPGGSGCDGAAPGANKRGGDGLQGGDPGPQSVALPLARFWQNTETVEVPVNAAVRDIGGRDYTVYVCGMYRTRDEVLDLPSGKPLRDLFYTAEVVTAINPCGLTKKLESGPWHVLGSKKFSGERIGYDPATNSPTVSALLGEGYWGIYTIVQRQRGATPCDVDPYQCDLEYISSDEVDTIVGVDLSAPSAAVSVPARTASRQIVGEVSAGDQAGLSGVERVRCDYGKGYTDCALGPISWAVDGEGAHSVKVLVTDAAGNTSGERVATAVVDVTAPNATATLDDGKAPGTWQREALSATLTRPMDDAADVAPGGSPSFVYQVDSGAVRTCYVTPCSVDLSAVGPGAHRLLFTAADAAGNRKALPEKGCPADTCLLFRFDDKAPVSTRTILGPRPVNGWYPQRPYVAFSAIDQIGASGVARIEYKLGAGTYTAFVPTAPPLLPEGASTVCWRAVDVAGNVETEQCDDPSKELKVDGGAPVVAPFTESVAPHASGIYTGDVTVTVAATDTGAGIDPALDPDPSDLCGPVPPRPSQLDPVVPSGLCVSVDGGDFQPQDAATADVRLTGAGRHVVRAFAVDVAGNRSPVREETYLIDAARPAVRAYTLWGAPSLSGWHRHQPLLVLRATDGPRDGVAGVTGIDYRVDGGSWTSYAGPVPLPAGTHAVEYRATDGVERVSDIGTVAAVRTDVARPVATPTAHTKSALTHTFVYTVGDEAAASAPHSAPTTATTRVYVFNERSQLVGAFAPKAVTVPAGGTATVTESWVAAVADPLLATTKYYFRVVVTDQSGHVTQSEESSAV